MTWMTHNIGAVDTIMCIGTAHPAPLDGASLQEKLRTLITVMQNARVMQPPAVFNFPHQSSTELAVLHDDMQLVIIS
jgi:hypothetical protein